MPAIEPWNVQTYSKLPRLRNVRVQLPARRARQSRGFPEGPETKTMLWRRRPRQVHVTAAPVRIAVARGRKTLSPTVTEAAAAAVPRSASDAAGLGGGGACDGEEPGAQPSLHGDRPGVAAPAGRTTIDCVMSTGCSEQKIR